MRTADLTAPRHASILRVAPVGLFLLFVLLTVWVWWQQVQHQRGLLVTSTDEVCHHVQRRVQVLVESRLQVAEIFAQRWAQSTQGHGSQEHFEQLATLLLDEVPGFRVIALRAGDTTWTMPPQGTVWQWPAAAKPGSRPPPAAAGSQFLLGAPHPGASGELLIRGVRRLDRQRVSDVAVVFAPQTLLGAGFRHRTRAEFDVVIEDQGVTLFQVGGARPRPGVPLSLSRDFQVLNRTWRITVAPHRSQLARASWSANLLVPAFGLLVSLGLTLLATLLVRHVALVRRARDRAVAEVARREETEQALRVSEARYRSVFHSTTDGLLVIDEEDRIVEANPAAGSMHGYGPGELVGRSMSALVPPDQVHSYHEFKRQIAEFGTARVDAASQHCDGTSLDVEVRGASFHYGDEPRILAILTDVSERKRALERHALLSRKVLVAQEDERARLSRELHDELGQILTALHLELDWVRKRAGATVDLQPAVGMVERSAEELRNICRGLRPPLLDDLGLEPAVQALAEEFEARTRIRLDLELRLDESETPLPVEVALSAYRILQESLNNVSRHAQAREVSVSLIHTPEELLLSVYDDGRGFDVSDPRGAGGCGLAGMRERASLVGGIVDIRSEQHQGTRVSFRVPLETPWRHSDDQDPGG